VALVLDSTSDRVYCASSQTSDVRVIDCGTHQVIATITVGLNPQDLVWNPARNRVYSANSTGSSISVLNDAGAVEEGRSTPDAARRTFGPTIVRDFLDLPFDICNLVSDIALLDVSGRRVLTLHPGPNDVSRLAPGVYFVPTALGVARVVSVR
jgi:YVTN family beta-propeller protein